MLLTLLLRPAALDKLLNALVHQYLGELISRSSDVELSLRPECVLQRLIIIVEVEVELGEQIGDE